MTQPLSRSPSRLESSGKTCKKEVSLIANNLPDLQVLGISNYITILLYNYVHIKIRINVFVYVQFLGNKKCRPFKRATSVGQMKRDAA